MKHLTTVVCGLFLAVTIMTFNPSLTASILLPYGGRTTAVFPCINGVLITVAGARPGIFLDTPATYRYANFVPALRPGQAQLGKAGPPAPCLIMVPTFFGPVVTVAGYGLLKVFEGTSL